MEQRNKDIDIDSDLIFSNYQGDLLNIKSVQTTFKNICDDIGVEYKGLHALRHTFGSMLIKKHIDIKVVSELLGHTDVRFTYNRYIHIIAKNFHLFIISKLFFNGFYSFSSTFCCFFNFI